MNAGVILFLIFASGARTEDTYLGSYPFTFFYLESFS